MSGVNNRSARLSQSAPVSPENDIRHANDQEYAQSMRHLLNGGGVYGEYIYSYCLGLSATMNSSNATAASNSENALNNGNESMHNASSADLSGYRILAFQVIIYRFLFIVHDFQKGQAPRAPMGYVNQAKVLYSARALPMTSCSKGLRRIPNTAERILDAPAYLDDYCEFIY
jgi:hypothetical protein